MRSAAPQLSLFPPEDDIPEVTGSGDLHRLGDAPGFAIRESARARRLSIKVFPRGNVEIVVPRRTRPSDVAAFVAANREWILKTRLSFADEHVPEPFRLPQLIELPATESIFTVRYLADAKLATVHYRLRGNVLTLSGRVNDEKLCVKALRRWLSSIAKQEFAPRLSALSALTGLGYRRMQVRAQRTCWGSRSSTGTLSINLCLLFVRPELLRYLMIHELSHGRHMNHSRRFWALVGRYEPRYRRLDRELGDSWKVVPTWLGIY